MDEPAPTALTKMGARASFLWSRCVEVEVEVKAPGRVDSLIWLALVCVCVSECVRACVAIDWKAWWRVRSVRQKDLICHEYDIPPLRINGRVLTALMTAPRSPAP